MEVSLAVAFAASPAVAASTSGACPASWTVTLALLWEEMDAPRPWAMLVDMSEQMRFRTGEVRRGKKMEE